jgi:hypothetical protein
MDHIPMGSVLSVTPIFVIFRLKFFNQEQVVNVIWY